MRLRKAQMLLDKQQGRAHKSVAAKEIGEDIEEVVDEESDADSLL